MPKTIRRGFGKGRGKGYKNLIPRYDSNVHSNSARGIKRPQAIKKLYLDKYQGRWYQIKAIPTWFQRACKQSVAEYKKKKDYVEVKNTCKKNGEESSITGKAYPLNRGKSKLEVDFIGGRILTGDYWVLFTDYETSVVGTPDKKNLWILSRRKSIPDEKLKRLISIAKKQGFDISRLR